MNRDKCYEVGYISKTRGLKGDLIIFLDVDEPELYVGIDSILIEVQNRLVPYLVKSLRLEGKKAVMHLDDIDHVDQASTLTSCRLFLPLDFLPKLEEGQFYYHDVLNYQIIDRQLGALGKITAIYDGVGNQDLIAMHYQGKEVLIPIVDGIVLKANHERKELEVNLPDGLIDIYLEE